MVHGRLNGHNGGHTLAAQRNGPSVGIAEVKGVSNLRSTTGQREHRSGDAPAALVVASRGPALH
jgi:hypothetical protein